MDKKLLKLVGTAVNEAVGKEFDKIKKEVKKVKKEVKFVSKEGEQSEKSVMNTKSHLAPFVKLGSKMETFVKDMKNMIRGAQFTEKAAAFNEGTDADGGYTVPEELETSILSFLEEEAIVRSRATKIKMKSDTWKKNKLDQSSSQFGGVSVSWVGESETATDTSFALTQISMTAKKMLMLTTESREILSDSNIDFANYVVNIFGRAMAYYEDYYLLRGNGTTQPYGLLADTDISVVNRAVANQVSYADVISMFYTLKPQFRKNSIWVGGTDVIEYVDSLVDATTGRPLWADSLREGTPPKLKGRSFIETEKVPELGTKGDLSLTDFSWYYIGDREGITVDVSIHDRFRYDEVTVRLVKRIDGVLAMKEASVILDVPSVS